MSSLINIQSLNYQYDSSSFVFRDLSLLLDSEQGSKKVLIVGANGVGKSTLLKLIAGIISSNNIQVEANSLSYFGHELQLYPELSVTDNLSYLFEVLEIRNQEEAIAIWQLDSFLDKKITNLSAGQKKRVALAAYASFQQDLVLLDEPSVNLDEIGRSILAKQLQVSDSELVLIASHDLSYFLPQVDQVIFLSSDSVVIETGDFSDPQLIQRTKQAYLELIK